MPFPLASEALSRFTVLDLTGSAPGRSTGADGAERARLLKMTDCHGAAAAGEVQKPAQKRWLKVMSR